MSESFAELFEESLGKTQMQPGQLVTGEVVEISDEVVIVHAGCRFKVRRCYSRQ